MQLVDGQPSEYLLRAGRPTDRHTPEALVPQPEMQSAIVLAAKSHPAIDNLPLPRRAELDGHLGADRAAIAARADQLELEPVARSGRVLIQQCPALLIGNHHIQYAVIEQIGHRDGSSIQPI